MESLSLLQQQILFHWHKIHVSEPSCIIKDISFYEWLIVLSLWCHFKWQLNSTHNNEAYKIITLKNEIDDYVCACAGTENNFRTPNWLTKNANTIDNETKINNMCATCERMSILKLMKFSISYFFLSLLSSSRLTPFS